MLRRALATTAIVTLSMAVWAPAALAADTHGHGPQAPVTAPGQAKQGEQGAAGSKDQGKPTGGSSDKSTDGKAGPAAAGTCASAPDTTTTPTDTTTAPTDSTTAPVDSSAAPRDSTTTTSAVTKDQGYCQGQANHHEAVQKVMTRLQDKLSTLNPTAAANVSDVVSRLEDELKVDGSATDTADADAQLESALTANAQSGTASKSDLDVLAQVQAKLGKDDAVQATQEQRIAKDPSDKNAYVALGQTLAKKGAPDEITTFVAGKKVGFGETKPIIRDNHTLVPVRATVEALGAHVSWDPATRTVTITKDSKVVVLTIGSDTATINGESVKLEVPAGLEGGSTVIPVRFVAEMLGMKVAWVSEGKLIVVTNGDITPGGTTTTDATTGTETTTGTSTGTGTTTP